MAVKKVLVAFTMDMLDTIDRQARAEHRSRSDMIREALRVYLGLTKKLVHMSQPRTENIHSIDEAPQIARSIPRTIPQAVQPEPAQSVAFKDETEYKVTNLPSSYTGGGM